MKLPRLRADRGCRFCRGSEEGATRPWIANRRCEWLREHDDDPAGAYVCSGCVEGAAAVLAGLPRREAEMLVRDRRRGVHHSWRSWAGVVRPRPSAMACRADGRSPTGGDDG